LFHQNEEVIKPVHGQKRLLRNPGIKQELYIRRDQKAYRKVAMQHHPDRNPGDKAAKKKFKEALKLTKC
jgi:hypothetical protein